MIIIPSENIKHYFYLLGNFFDLYVKVCPYCLATNLIRWGFFYRGVLPDGEKVRIQRIYCKSCGRTFRLLPSFLLAHKSFSVLVVEQLVRTIIQYPLEWQKWLTMPIDLSTACRWLGRLRAQIQKALPLMRQHLLTLRPEAPLGPPPVSAPLDDATLLERFLAVSDQLFQAATALTAEPPKTTLFGFINTFLAQKTGRALLAP